MVVRRGSKGKGTDYGADKGDETEVEDYPTGTSTFKENLYVMMMIMICYSLDDGNFFLVASNTALNFIARFIFPLIFNIPFMNAVN